MNILMTGGATGLGESIIKNLHKDHFIYFTYSKSEKKAQELESQFHQVKGLFCDFTQADSVQELAGKLESFNLEVLINNAYVGMDKNQFIKNPIENFQRSFEYNILPTLTLTQAALKLFKKNKFGKIINILSSAILGKPQIGWSDYIANKSYLLAMSKCWASEYSRYNISSNSVSQGFMKTPFTQDIDERLIEQIQESNPLGRLISPDEVAEAVSFLVQSSQQINGINLTIDNNCF